MTQKIIAFRKLFNYLKPKQKMKKERGFGMKFVSIILAFTATFTILSSTSVPSKAKTNVADPVTVELPVQHYDFEDSPIYISVKK